MRLLTFALACTCACFVFFGDVAPGSYTPPDVKIIPDAPSAPADVAESAAAAETAAPLHNAAPRKASSLERARAALAQSTASAPSDDEICSTLVEVARSNDLPLGFFTNLIWQESRFDHDAISRVGAMGLAQFMPDVAEKMSVDAFDSRSALPGSARLLRTLRARFGNLGLAAAAYNAGPKRVSDWLEGRSGLPKETQDYVHLITGHPAAHWQGVKSRAVVYRVPRTIPCHRLPTFASVEQAERAQQEQIAAEESRRAELARLAEQKAREAARRQIAEKGKKAVARQGPMRLAQVKR